jgi:hypothetical protein
MVLGLLLTAAVVRGGALWVWSDNLSQDRDAYLSLAEGLAAGRGYSVHDTEVPTAFRPPLYPLLLAAAEANRSPVMLGLVHLLLGTATVWLTYRLGRRLSLGDPLSIFAAALVAFDPLLLRYTSFPMTETLAAFLTTALLVAIAGNTGLRQQILTGLLLGLCVLCRPTLWAFAGLMLARWVVNFVRGGTLKAAFGRPGLTNGKGRIGRSRAISAASDPGTSPNRTTGGKRRLPWLMVMTLVLTVAPWVVRNMLVMGRPILMTTHGGYTLLLGNNPVFYREVVVQPWGTMWDGAVGDGQTKWAAAINAEMQAAGVTGEVSRDRWMRRRALDNIRAQPDQFLRACMLRLRRFWSLTPSGAAARPLSPAVNVALGVWFGGIFVLAAIGLVRILRSGSPRWAPALLMLAAFVAVHLVYWSNARMRAPVVPVIALLAAKGVSRTEAGGDQGSADVAGPA